MNKFKFNLESILTLRSMDENKAMQVYALVCQKKEYIINLKKECESSINLIQKEMLSLRKIDFKIDKSISYIQFLKDLFIQKKDFDNLLKENHEEEKKALNEYLKAKEKKDILIKIKEKKKKEYNLEFKQKEEKQLEDLICSRHKI